MKHSKAPLSLNTRTTLASLLTLGSIGTGTALAQEAPDQVPAQEVQDEQKTLKKVVVTGSNIRSRKKDFQTPSPIQTVGAPEIADTGALQVQDIFKGITSNSGSILAQDVTLLQGTSQFSLRGLGVGSTLTLINGRRAGLAPVADSAGQLFTDSNQYPVNMIRQVEVLTDGASSTYGSEAVAGVVNIFTRDDFEGFELTLEARDTTNQSAQVGAAFGVQDEKGGLTIFGNFYTQTEAWRSDFPNILQGSTFEDGAAGAWDSATGSPGRYNLAIPDGSGGWLRASTPSVADPDCTAAGGIDTGDNCRYYFIDQRRIIPEEFRFSMFSSANYDLTDRLNVFAEVGFSRNDIRDQNGGMLLRTFPTAGGFLVPSDHPFNFFVGDGAGGISYAGPDAFAADPTLTAVPLIYRGRVIGRDGDREAGAEIKTIFTNTRVVGGFDYELGDNWLLYGSYVWSNSDFTRAAPREWDVPTFNALIQSGDWNPFGTRITNPGLVSPRDGVSVANNDDVFSLVDGIRNDRKLVRQRVGELSLSGELPWTLGGGNAAVAFGGQLRDVLLEDVPDGRYQTGNNRLNESIPPVFGEQSVYALFGEVNLPITDTIEVQAAVRFEDYGDQGGDTTDPKVSGKWDVTDNLSLRGSWGTSFQAPSIRQVAGVTGNASINDPLDPTGGTFIISVITQGSDDLVPQSAENLNLGAIFRNDNFDISLDYFTYDYQDLILPDGDPQQIFNDVAAGLLPADRALRGADGQVATAIAEFRNRGSAEVAGLDFVGAYRTELGEGDLKFDLKTTLLTKYDSSEFGDILGNRNFANGFGSTPDLRANAGVTYSVGAHRFNFTGRHIGSYDDDQSGDEIDSNTTFDIRYDVELGELWNLPGSGTSFSIGSVNVFDESQPRLTLRPNIDFEVHDPRSRQVYVSLKQSF